MTVTHKFPMSTVSFDLTTSEIVANITTGGTLMVTVQQQREFRRRPRSRIACPVTVEAGQRILQGETLNLGPSGAKLRLEEHLQEGTAATLHFTPAEARPMDVEAIVWRNDDYESVFFFLKATSVDLQPPL